MHGCFHCLWILAAGFSVGCAGERSVDISGNDCIINRGIRDYDVLNRQNLIIYGPGGNAYHVELTIPANNLDNEISIGIYEDGDGRICPYGRDAILVDGPIPQRIQIRNIDAVNDEEVDMLLVEFGVIEGAEETVTVIPVQ